MQSDLETWRSTMIGDANVPTMENDVTLQIDDPLILVPDHDITALHSHQDPDEKSPDVYLRQTVAEKLQSINTALKTEGLELLVREGWRSIDQQIDLWETTLERMHRRHPALSYGECIEKAKVLCVNPYSGDRISAHQTGGAIDCTIRYTNDSKTPLVMSHADILADDRDRTQYCEVHDNEAWMQEAKINRRLLYNAMITHGFVNYKAEWWHYEWGTTRWAQAYGHDESNVFSVIKTR